MQGNFIKIYDTDMDEVFDTIAAIYGEKNNCYLIYNFIDISVSLKKIETTNMNIINLENYKIIFI